MKIKMKRLDYSLICLLSGVAPLAPQAQAQTQTQSATPSAAVSCDDQTCVAEDGLLFRLHTPSYDQPVTRGTGPASSSAALQPDRRATLALSEPGRAVATGKFSVELPDGGLIWATEDPALGAPELSVSALGLVPYDGRRITRAVPFYVRSNYAAFIDRLELRIYLGSDHDLIDPLVTLPINVAAAAQLEWDGVLPDHDTYRPGDVLVYVLRAYDAEGRFDETVPQTLQLAKPEEVERGAALLRERTEKVLGTALTDAQAQQQSLIDEAFAANGLRLQNIPIHGSRIRLQGRRLPEGQALRINGDTYPVDLERKFVAEYLAPIGQHRFEVEVGSGSQAAARHVLDVEVTGQYFFAVGLADVTVRQNRTGGAGGLFATDRRGDDDVLSDGRLAFYLKGKSRGRYLITAQADTTERELGRLFDGFTRAEPRDIFRRLDPDLYYPVHGDDSSTWRDVDTMGRFYLRMDWDKNQALWGNYATGITGTEFGQYQRSLYGAALNWRSRAANAWGDPGTQLKLFGAEAQAAPGHSEFIGTGGSLYYLRHTDLLPGSDQVVLEIRDPTTGRVVQRVPLQRGADYEIDELQGRLQLSRVLAQVTREHLPTITRDAPLDGYEQRLIVDYEWVPNGFDANDVTAGFRGKHWFGNHVAVGATYVDENRAGQDYALAGGDLTLQAGKGTYLKAEYTQTESYSTPVFFSDNGGFTFTQINPVGPREGEAKAVEARANFRELGWTALDWNAGAWWRSIGPGYSIGRYDHGLEVQEHGVELSGRFTQALGIYARYSEAERGAEMLRQAQVSSEWRVGDYDALVAELRQVEQRRAGADGSGTLGALQYTRRLGTALDIYGVAQLSFDESGDYAPNDAYTLGARYLFGDLSTLGGEVSSGDRGDAASLNAEYRMSPEHTFYGGYTYSTDRTDYDPLFNARRQNGWTLGQRWRVSNQVNLFNESQYLKSPHESGLAHTFGMDFYPALGWNLGFTLSDGALVNQAGGEVDRRAISLSGGRTSPDTSWQSRVEWRRDAGAERREQWVTTHRLTHKLDESWRVSARVNYADTDDLFNPAASARFVEGNLGFAYRPWHNTRWGLFGRYTYLYDLATLAQIGGADYDQRTEVLSLEGVYRFNRHWELAGKLARREGQVRYGRGGGDWAASDTTFAAVQLRYELMYAWHALGEYRRLDVDGGGTRQGWLVGVDRDLNRHFRLGVGYNFTEFSDDLTNFDYDHRGLFINLVGSY